MTLRSLTGLMVAATLSAGIGSSNGATILIDFGTAGTADESTTDSLGRVWNNVTNSNDTQVGGHNLVPTTGGPSIANLVVTNPPEPVQVTNRTGFSNVGSNGNGTTTPSGNLAAKNWPASAIKDNLYGHTGNFNGQQVEQVRLVFSGLGANVPYNLDFFASRTGTSENRTTQFTVQGTNSSTVLLNAANNHSNIVTAFSILPDANNQIIIDITKDSEFNNSSTGFYHLGIMEISAVPEPVALGLLGLGSVALLRRRSIA